MTLDSAASPGGFLSTGQVAARIGNTTAQHVRQLISVGRLPAINIAKGNGRPRYRVSEAAVAAFLRAATVNAPSEVA